jgi:hypothetical protein
MKKPTIKQKSSWGVLILAISLFINGCGQKENQETISPELQLEIIKNCVSQIQKDAPMINFLVNPQFQRFEFNSYFKENHIMEKYQPDGKYNYDKKKAETLKLLAWSNEDFLDAQREANKIYLNKNNLALLDFSNASQGNFVISFSGINKNLVFADLIQYPKFIAVSELKSSSFIRNEKFMSATCIIFILKDNQVEKVFYDCDITNN